MQQLSSKYHSLSLTAPLHCFLRFDCYYTAIWLLLSTLYYWSIVMDCLVCMFHFLLSIWKERRVWEVLYLMKLDSPLIRLIFGVAFLQFFMFHLFDLQKWQNRNFSLCRDPPKKYRLHPVHREGSARHVPAAAGQCAAHPAAVARYLAQRRDGHQSSGQRPGRRPDPRLGNRPSMLLEPKPWL